ncbi:hypothetical protein AURDEDRAFT_58590, partial [Auricularia subglabra TFB-10046 SS5]
MLNSSLTSAYLTSAGVNDETEKLRKRIDALEASTSRRSRIWQPSVNNHSLNPFRVPPPSKPAHAAHLADADDDALDEPVSLELQAGTHPELVGQTAALAQTVYAYLGAKTRPQPSSYSFPRSDVVSKRMPPSPCKVCGSPKHWDKECGHYQSYLTRRAQNALIATEHGEVEEKMYENVYSIYSNESAFSLCAMAPSDFSFTSDFFWGAPSVEDVEDEADASYRASPKWTGRGLLVLAQEAGDAEDVLDLLPGEDSDDEDDNVEYFPAGAPSIQAAVFAQALAAAALRDAEGVGPPPRDVPVRGSPDDDSIPERVIRMPKKREHAEGHSSKGITVLSTRGHVGTPLDNVAMLTLDSGASLSLVNKAFLARMRHPPKIRRGLSVCIAQLTSQTPDIEGFVKLPVFIRSEDGTLLEFEAETYVVPSMTVDVLLGEDWHLNYEMQVLRSVTEGTRVGVGESGFYFPARSSHRRAKAARRRRKASIGNGQLLAYRDTVIPAGTTVLVDIAGDLQQDRDWFVDRNIVTLGRDSLLSVPNCLLSTRTEAIIDEHGHRSIARRSRLPVSNPSGSDLTLRAGTLLAHAKDPKDALTTPADEDAAQQ